jgi:hypothetical protein
MWQAETGMYFRVDTGYLPFALKSLFQFQTRSTGPSLRSRVMPRKELAHTPLSVAEKILRSAAGWWWVRGNMGRFGVRQDQNSSL